MEPGSGAVQIPGRRAAALRRIERTSIEKEKERAKGFEPSTNVQMSAEEQQLREAGAPKALPPVCPPLPADAELVTVVDAWQSLPSAIRAGIVAMVRATCVAS